MSPAPQYRYVLPESELPTRWYNLVPDLPVPPPPPLHPGTLQPVGPDDLAPLFPMDLILQEVTSDRYVDIPEEVQDVYRLWRPSPLHRAHRLEQAARHPGAHLLQVRGRLAGRLAQAEHRCAAGVLQRQGRSTPPHHRDRRRAVGDRARLRLLDLRAGLRGLAGRRVVRPEAVPPAADGDVRRDRAPLAVAADPGRAVVRGRPPGIARHRDLRGGRGRGPGRGHAVRARQRAQPRADAPDGDRRGGDACSSRWPGRHRT